MQVVLTCIQEKKWIWLFDILEQETNCSACLLLVSLINLNLLVADSADDVPVHIDWTILGPVYTPRGFQ